MGQDKENPTSPVVGATPTFSSAPQPSAPATNPNPTETVEEMQKRMADEARYAEELRNAPDIVLQKDKKPKNKKMIFLVIFAVVVIAICITLTVISSNMGGGKKGKGSKATSTYGFSIDEIFDEKAYIPTIQDNKYGYINPEDGKWVIDARFQYAERFYGDYAIVTDNSKRKIINKKGEVVVEQKNSEQISYIIDSGLWFANGDIYDKKMKKINPDNTVAKDIYNGYLFVIPITESTELEEYEEMEGTEAESGVVKEGEDSTGNTTSTSSASDSTYSTDPGYIIDMNGNTIYECESSCTAITIKNSDSIYAVINANSKPGIIINLDNGESIYTASGAIVVSGDRIYERSNDGVKYLSINNNEVKTIKAPVQSMNMHISEISDYWFEVCGETVSIKSEKDTIVGCEVTASVELSKYTYMYLKEKQSVDAIIIEKGNGVELFDMAKKETLKNFGLSSIEGFIDSPFILVNSFDSGKTEICNIFKKDKTCVVIEEEGIVEGYANYLTIGEKIYNANLEAIR